MASTVINTREDLDAIADTIEHDVFMATLRGTLWRLEKDDAAKAWRAVEDNSTIERFGFTRADFPGAVAPALPEWQEQVYNVSQITKLQFIEWCEANNKLAALIDLLNSDALLKFKWDAATFLEITNPLVQGAAQALSMDAQAVFNEIMGQS